MLRYRGMLRCEWCGRMAEVPGSRRWAQAPVAEWVTFAAEHPVWYCSRPRCVTNRAELSLRGDRHAEAASLTAADRDRPSSA